ncbi:multifunctional oxoglutarate decarboxylase/oxoglutarate dehydrogenase thiamine pyrophosphate-binding subunit/dihydrolipoyllysine-residue succinyltransferase subunit, partial [Streptomyces sp. NPDC059605]
MSSQSPSNSSISTDQASTGANPAAAFGPNEWLVDEIYQQYLQDPNSVDRAWWDFFADYKPGASGTADKPVPGAPAPAAPVTPAAPAQPAPAQAPAPAAKTPAPAAPAPAQAAAPAKAAPAPAAKAAAPAAKAA